MTQKNLILAVETSSRVGSVAIATGRQLLAESVFSGPMKHSAELFPAICNLLSRFEKKSQDIEQIYISVGPGSFTGLRIAVTLAKAMNLANSAKIVPVDTLDVIAANVINLTSLSDERRLSAVASTLRSKATAEDGSAKAEATSNELIAPILDAKRGQFYIAVYQKQTAIENTEKKLNYKLNSANSANSAVKGWKKVIPDSIMTANEFLNKFACSQKPIWLLGDGLVYHKDRFEADGVYFFDEKFWSPHASMVHQLGWNKAQAGEFADPLLLTPNYLLRPEVTLKRK